MSAPSPKKTGSPTRSGGQIIGTTGDGVSSAHESHAENEDDPPRRADVNHERLPDLVRATRAVRAMTDHPIRSRRLPRRSRVPCQEPVGAAGRRRADVASIRSRTPQPRRRSRQITARAGSSQRERGASSVDTHRPLNVLSLIGVCKQSPRASAPRR